MGLGLAYIAYKTRSLSTAIVAHLVYNLMSLGAVWLTLHSVSAGSTYALLAAVFSIAALYMHWRGYRKAKNLAVRQAKLDPAIVSLILFGAMIFQSLAPQVAGGKPQAVSYQISGWVDGAGFTQDPAAPQAASAKKDGLVDRVKGALGIGEHKLMDFAAVTAQAEPAVVRITAGNGLGSGFVISKTGWF